MNEKRNPSVQLSFKNIAVLMIIFAAALLTAPLGHSWQKGQQHGSMPGMDMHVRDPKLLGCVALCGAPS